MKIILIDKFYKNLSKWEYANCQVFIEERLSENKYQVVIEVATQKLGDCYKVVRT